MMLLFVTQNNRAYLDQTTKTDNLKQKLWQARKAFRIVITLECTECRTNTDKRSAGVSRYTTMKNRRNTTGRMELKKFCTHCNSHTVHKEIK